MSETEIRILIVDDEPLARDFIRLMLEQEQGVEVIGECGNGREAVSAIREERPDVVFLDVQMPEMDGFTVLEALGAEATPPVVFTTAYEQYAIRAFETHAIDYLLKPFDPERFGKAMRHVRERLRGRWHDEDRRRVAALLDHVRGRPEYLDRLPVKGRGRITFLKVDAIDWIEADDKYVHLHTGDSSHMVRQPLGAMEGQLDPKKFLRVSRSAIVNVEHIKELRPLFTGEHVIVLEDGTELTLSRNYKERLFERLGKPL